LAGSSQGWGIAVVAGTGSNCWGWDRNHNIGRVTGVGIGEYGGAGDLVNQALIAIAHEWTKRGKKTQLSNEFLQKTSAKDIPTLIEGIEIGTYDVGPDYAPLVYKAASNGDRIALSIIQWAGAELGQTAVAVIRQLGFEKIKFEVVLVGSIFEMGDMIITPMQQIIFSEAPKAVFVRLSAPPVVGGVLLAMQQIGINPAPLREHVIASTKILIKRNNL
jgi:N-acetylglucosamine kinase-like BadF-type ATPase